MIGIRVDANEKIAMGHLMRCISIAKQLKKQNREVLFILSEEYAARDINKNGFEYLCLHNKYNEKEMELGQLIYIIQEYKIEKMLLDSYDVTEMYMKELKKYCKLIYLDDMNSFKYPADIIINYTYGTEISQYIERGYIKELFLLGREFVPLRPEFSGNAITIKPEVENIMITTGGTDEYDVIVGLLTQLENLQNVKKSIVVGKFYKNIKTLKKLAMADALIEIYQDISDIYGVMKRCDMAISAGGTTLAELCACGVPTICFSMADNQLAGTKAYSKEKMMIYAGDVREHKDEVINEIGFALAKLKNDYKLREQLSQRAKTQIDGKGAMRIAEEIIKL